MSLFSQCSHQWEEEGRTYQAPSVRPTHIDNINAFGSQVLLFGQTNIELRCKHCGDIKVNREIGKVENDR